MDMTHVGTGHFFAPSCCWFQNNRRLLARFCTRTTSSCPPTALQPSHGSDVRSKQGGDGGGCDCLSKLEHGNISQVECLLFILRLVFICSGTQSLLIASPFALHRYAGAHICVSVTGPSIIHGNYILHIIAYMSMFARDCPLKSQRIPDELLS